MLNWAREILLLPKKRNVKMIFYFTGTGNSLWVAKMLGEALNEPLVSITEQMREEKDEFVFSLKENERILFVYPVHSWGPAIPVNRFAARLKLDGYKEQPVYSVCTCGDDCGYTTNMLHKTLSGRGIGLTDGFCVFMPNNYILMPGFDVDSEEVEQNKLKEAYSRVESIVYAISKGKKVNLYKKGSMPFLKSYLVHPLFVNFATGRNSFRVTDACISCGLCEKVCPTNTISLVDGHPVWKNTCVQCVACIHRCPVRAIEYGKETLKKGRYHHPGIK